MAKTLFPYALFSAALIFGAVDASAQNGSTSDAPAQDDRAEEKAAEEPADSDNVAASLNAAQRLKQSYTLTRTVDGEVVERESREIAVDDDAPTRPTEAGVSALERLKADFDGETLTRREAVDAARLDFALADKNRDGVMSADEFDGLAAIWRTRDAIADASGRAPAATPVEPFPTLASQDFLARLMAAFDDSDSDGDGVLRGEQLTSYGAARFNAPAIDPRPREDAPATSALETEGGA